MVDDECEKICSGILLGFYNKKYFELADEYNFCGTYFKKRYYNTWQSIEFSFELLISVVVFRVFLYWKKSWME